MVKMVSAILAAAVIAAAVILVPGLSQPVDAKTAKHKGDRLDLAVRAANCGQTAWPYYDQNCRKDTVRPVRRVTTDRM